MNDTTTLKSARKTAAPAGAAASQKPVITLKEHIVEIISDSGEGAQTLRPVAGLDRRAGWATASGPRRSSPPRSARRRAASPGASGNRIRIGAGYITNGGDETDLVVAFNEQVLLGRVRDRELKPGCTILLESMWRDAPRPEDRARPTSRPTTSWWRPATRCTKSRWSASAGAGRRCAARQEHVRARHAVQHLQPRSAARARPDRAHLRQEGPERGRHQHQAARSGLTSGPRPISTSGTASRPCARPSRRSWSTATRRWRWACWPRAWKSARCIRSRRPRRRRTTCREVFEKVGGMVHQAEDEIAACAFAIGASYAGKCTVTITSGPGYSLKQEGDRARGDGARFRWSSSTCSAAAPAPASRPRRSRAT